MAAVLKERSRRAIFLDLLSAKAAGQQRRQNCFVDDFSIHIGHNDRSLRTKLIEHLAARAERKSAVGGDDGDSIEGSDSLADCLYQRNSFGANRRWISRIF